jgi:hypothetical protein
MSLLSGSPLHHITPQASHHVGGAGGDERIGATLKRANADAAAWIERNQRAKGTESE